MRNITAICLALPLFLLACHSNRTDHTADTTATVVSKHSKLDIEAIKKQLVLQQGMDTPDYPGIRRYYLQAKDIDLTVQVIREGLIDAGYLIPGRAEFDKRIKEIYHIENPDHKMWKGPVLTTKINPDSWKSGESFTTPYKENSDYTEDTWYHMIAFGKYNFVFEITPLRELITFDKNGEYKITIPQYLIVRNNYLFYHDVSNTDDLVHDDKKFVNSLVAGFGYDTELEFNMFVLNKYDTGTASDEGIGKLVFNYQNPGKLLIRKGFLDYIDGHTNPYNNNLYLGLEQFTIGLANSKKYANIPFADRCKMVAYAGALGEKVQNNLAGTNRRMWSPHTLLTTFKMQYPEFIDEIKKQNYYNEPHIKLAVTSAEEN